MSAETKAFALQKKGVILWRGQALLDRRVREKEERKEKGKERGWQGRIKVQGPGAVNGCFSNDDAQSRSTGCVWTTSHI